MNSVIPEMKRAPPKRSRPSAKLPSALTTSTTSMVTAPTTRLFPIHRQKNFTNTLSCRTMKR